MSARRQRSGWRFRATQRKTIIPGVARVNINWPRVVRAIADGPGGERLRHAVSWTVGWLGHATVNTRTGRGSIDTPGLGSFQGPLIPSQREREHARRRRHARELDDDLF